MRGSCGNEDIVECKIGHRPTEKRKGQGNWFVEAA
jgi:hypothetical protein